MGAASDAALNKRLDRQQARARYVIYAIVGLMALAGALQLWGAIFPDLPTVLNPRDSATLNAVLFGGPPALILCNNGSSVDARSRDVFEAAYRRLKGEVACYSLDCTAPLKGGESAAVRFGLTNARPQVFMVSYGRKPQQVLHTMTRDGLEKEARRLAVNRKMSIGHSGDLATCWKDRSGGCLMVYSTRAAEDVGQELAPLLPVFPTIKFASLNAAALALQPPPNSGALRVLNTATRIAREAASRIVGVKGELLVLARRLPASAGGEGGSFLITVGNTLTPGHVALADVTALTARSKAALEGFSGGASSGGGGDAIDALLARDEELEAAGSAIVGKGEVTIARAKKVAAPAPAAPEGRAEERAARREEARAAAAEARQQQQGAGGEEESPEAAAERERAVRAAMAAQEAESAYVAHLAGEEEELLEAGGQDREEEEVELLFDDEEEEGEAVDVRHRAGEGGGESGGEEEQEGEGDL